MQTVQDLKHAIDRALMAHLPQCRHPGALPLDNAIHYSVFPGGKRLRPILSVLGAKIFDVDPSCAIPAACAVEFVHTSSLIFDDLPCMDDAEIRRGVPVVHRVYGEQMALLAGIALLNRSYEIFGKTSELIAEATRCVGVEGMIGGQSLDLAPLPDHAESTQQRNLRLTERNRKTSAMMRLAFTAGALACGITASDVEPLGAAGQSLGEAYQICDDMLDARSSSEHTGKTAGQDGRHRRISHAALDEQACTDQVSQIIADTRTSLSAAYGSPRVAGLMGNVDRLFLKLIPGSRDFSQAIAE